MGIHHDYNDQSRQLALEVGTAAKTITADAALINARSYNFSPLTKFTNACYLALPIHELLN
jgi:hypothetical protein